MLFRNKMNCNVCVLGFGSQCNNEMLSVAYNCGQTLSKLGCTVLTGGVGGVFEAARKGCLDNNGTAIAFIESENESRIKYSTATISLDTTSLKRLVLVNAVCAGILIGGWTGSLDLVIQMVNQRKNVWALKDSGGIADQYGGKYLVGVDSGYIPYIDSVEDIEKDIQALKLNG